MDTPVPESAAIIDGIVQPVVGFPVHFHGRYSSGEPQAALITRVWGLRMVNLVIFGRNGEPPRTSTSVLLRQPGDAYPAESDYCEWIEVEDVAMPEPMVGKPELRLATDNGTTISGSIHD